MLEIELGHSSSHKKFILDFFGDKKPPKIALYLMKPSSFRAASISRTVVLI
jgi:hypothetical protein